MLETIKGKTVVELKACEANAVAITDLVFDHPSSAW
jgi:hypothetical protein